MTEHQFQYKGEFKLENGQSLHDIQIAYHTAGNLNQAKDNVIWVCHALTANSDVAEWWPNMVGDGLLFDTNKYFIICANFLGSCYGTTGPLSINPKTGKPYYHEFPLITIRDMVSAHELLRKHLGIPKIFMITGGSIGSFQALEWSIMNPSLIEHLVFLVSGASASPWNIAINESQRLAINADPTFKNNHETAGLAGLKAARSIALLSYRNAATYNKTQQDTEEKLDHFRAISYQQYQGDKLVKRFNAYSYYTITKAFDTHNVGRKRGGIEKALSLVKAKTLLIAISSDILFFPDEIRALQKSIPNAEYIEIDSLYGHDGFLIETEKLTKIIKKLISG
ncbi:MAG: homoserine O-acetyltransferase [Bacteroidales bacterium]